MISFEYLYNRKVPLIYTAPAVCEFDFSGTGEPTIYLAPITRVGAPTGLVFGGVGGFTLTWNVVPGAICYSIYRSINEDDPYGPYALVAECLQDYQYDVPEDDFHYYRVEAITEDGVTDLSDPIRSSGTPSPPVPPAPECTPEGGDACPSGTDAFDAPASFGEKYEVCAESLNPKTAIGVDNAIPWDQVSIALSDLVLVGGDEYDYTFAGDYPPGTYAFRWVSGLNFLEPYILPPPDNYWGGVGFYYSFDDSNPGPPTGYLTNWLTQADIHGIDCVFGGESLVVASGQNKTGSTLAIIEGALESFFRSGDNEYLFGAASQRGYHENDGGSFRLRFKTSVQSFDPPVGSEPIYQVLQVSGLRQQGRKIRVKDWSTVSAFLPATIRDFWTGDLDTRSVYTKTTCQWDQPAASTFGGAKVYYSQSRPEAANGCAWVIEIYTNVGLHWQGVKTVGPTPEGRYLRTALSAASPACLSVELKEIWNYPT